MYSDYHPNRREIWVESIDTTMSIEPRRKWRSYKQIMHRFKVHPDQQTAHELSLLLARDSLNMNRIMVTEPRYSTDDQILCKVVINTFNLVQ